MYSLAASWCTNFVRTEDNEHRWFIIFGPPQSSLAAANLLLSRMELKTQDKLTYNDLPPEWYYLRAQNYHKFALGTPPKKSCNRTHFEKRVSGNFWIAMRKYRIRSTTKSALGKDRYEHLYNRLPSLAAPVCLVSLIHWTNYRFAPVNIFSQWQKALCRCVSLNKYASFWELLKGPIYSSNLKSWIFDMHNNQVSQVNVIRREKC